MNEKPNNNETSIEDEILSLDNLEKSFNSVMNSLVQSEGYNKFKDEYLKIYDAFKISHSNNIELIKKCKSLNSEIISNTTKVNSVMKLSQEDQRIISGLRFEFEKTWKLVEISQEKEIKSREIIDSLKVEVSKLAKLSETGGMMSFSQEDSMQNLQNEIDMLKKEINVQEIQLKTILKDLNEKKEKREKAIELVNLFQNEQDKLNNEILKIKDEGKIIEEEILKILNEISNIKTNLINSQNEILNSENNFENIKKSIENNKLILNGKKFDIREISERTKESWERVKLAQQLNEHKINHNKKFFSQIEEINIKIKEKNEKFIENENKLNEFNEIFKKSEIDFKDLQDLKNNTIEDVKTLRLHLNRGRVESLKLKHELSKIESSLINLKRAVSFIQNSTLDIKIDLNSEKKKKDAIETQESSVQNDITGQKIEMHQLYKISEALLTEINKNEEISSSYKSNTLVIELDKINKSNLCKNLDLQLNKIRNRIEKHDNLQKSLLEERDLVRRQLESLKQEAKTINNEISILATDILSAKEAIKKKDLECITIHHQCHLILEEIPKSEIKNQELSEKLKKTLTNISSIYNTLVRSRHLNDVALTDLDYAQRLISSIELDLRNYEVHSNNKFAEVNILREMVTNLSWTIKSESVKYTSISNSIIKYKSEIIQLIEIQKQYLEKTQHYKTLFKESINLDKNLLLLKCRSKALEEELEIPMNIHRWRFLEGTNPEHMQLIKMNQSLKNTFLLKLSTLQRLKFKLEKYSQEFNHINKKLKITITPEQKAAALYFTEVLDVKQKQLETVEQNVINQKNVVVGEKESIEILREQLNDIKHEFFDVKRKNNDLRTSIKTNYNNDFTSNSQSINISSNKSPNSLLKQNFIIVPNSKNSRKSSNSVLSNNIPINKFLKPLTDFMK